MKALDKRQRQVELVDQALPYLMELADICIEDMGGVTINVNGGRFVYVSDRKEELIKRLIVINEACENGDVGKVLSPDFRELVQKVNEIADAVNSLVNSK